MNKPRSDMTAKEFLSRAYRIDVRINAKLDNISSLRELATKTSATLSDMPRSSSPALQPIETIVMKMVDLENEINAAIDELIDTKREIMAALATMTNVQHQTVLELRYLAFRSWEQIAEAMGYTERGIYNLHQKALAQFAKGAGLKR